MEKEIVKSNKKQELKGLFLIKPNLFKDTRGMFLESWNKGVFNNLIGDKIDFVQDNHSSSYRNVIRGLHYQTHPQAQGKLIRCSQGKIFDVAVDIRKCSPTFSQWAGVILDSINHNQLWIPSGYAHGFLVLSEYADVNYKTTEFWSKENEYSIRWDDSDISIIWPKKSNDLNISKKDIDSFYLKDIPKDKLL